MSTAREGTARIVRRADYTPPAYWIDTVDLTFDLDPAKTRVLNRMRVRRNPEQPAQPLRLDGEDLNLARVLVNGQGASFRLDAGQLVLEQLPAGNEPFELEIFTTCCPEKNAQLSGLYISQGNFITQCEAEGFRRITYFLDRPDVMSVYTVTLRADKARYPVLLSNGNLVQQGDLDDGRHWAKWHDPHRKPCYLFALVAGNFACRTQPIRSRSGTDHLLQIYVSRQDLDKTEHALRSLMAAIAWDETRFGLPLDLERYMIVATSDFNMGAMENKGLNIFNTKYILANPATATDADYANIESVVAHEYFHNWTGNRVTCRDWFQLSLKEGLTVFRDQEFSQDMAGSPSARAVKRIEDVRVLRTAQFSEDAGPMAHPVRPEQYAAVDNFYTTTVYEKGAEVVRMMQTLVGRDGFARGLKRYLQRHDGQAATCDDFAQAMADANPDSELARRLSQFMRWYSQAGTPRVHVSSAYDAEARTYTLTLRQSCPPTPGQPNKEPFVIPVRMGLLDHQGRAVPDSDRLLVLHETETTVRFDNIDAAPIPSLLRGFSAPVILEHTLRDDELLVLLAHDSDPFNRWEAGQQLLLRHALAALQSEGPVHEPLHANVLQAMHEVLRHPMLDAAFKELVLTLPTETYIAEQLDEVDPQRVHAVREAMRAQLAHALHDDWVWAYEVHHDNGAYQPDPVSRGRRALAGLALQMLCVAARHNGNPVWPGKTYQRFKDATNMTDRFQALSALVVAGHELAQQALQRFHAQWRCEALVLDKWFALQAGAPDREGDTLARVQTLLRHPDFQLRNPNRARSLIGTYCHANPAGFHRTDGAGYAFWRDRVLEIDTFNPQVAARLARALDRWRKLCEPYRSAARAAIESVAAHPTLSADVREVVTHALADGC